MAGLKTTVVVGGKVENTTTTQMCSTAVLAKTGASMGLKMGDYDMDGAYNPQLASPAPLEYVEPKDITPDAIEDDMYSTDQIAQMYCRIKALEAQVESAETIIKAMHTEHNEAQERLAGSLLNSHKETQAKLEALREAHKANLHQELRSACGARGHRCDWRVAYEAVVQRSKAALELEKPK
jgi:hypothetical protein